MKSIRFFFTEDCNANCSNCLNKTFRSKGKRIEIDKFQRLCSYFESNNVQGIKIMGGEPTIHPQFETLINIAQNHFKRVSLFTNAISDNLVAFHPRENDGISYNFNFFNFFSKEKFLLDFPGYRAIEILINEDIKIDEVLKNVLSIRDLTNKRIILVLTLDCTANVFKERSTILPIFEELYLRLLDNNYDVRIDHALPLCYIYGTKIPIYNKGSICDTECAGLVDSSYNLRYCNQSHAILLNLFCNDRIVPFRIVENHLQMEYHRRELRALNVVCKNCFFYGNICNGGCFVASAHILKEDILNNIAFPIM